MNVVLLKMRTHQVLSGMFHAHKTYKIVVHR